MTLRVIFELTAEGFRATLPGLPEVAGVGRTEADALASLEAQLSPPPISADPDRPLQVKVEPVRGLVRSGKGEDLRLSVYQTWVGGLLLVAGAMGVLFFLMVRPFPAPVLLFGPVATLGLGVVSLVVAAYTRLAASRT